MLSIGHLHIHREELRSASFDEDRLTLKFEWPDTDLPLLVGMGPDQMMSFDHLEGWGDAVPVGMSGWRFVSGRNGRINITLTVQLLENGGTERPPRR